MNVVKRIYFLIGFICWCVVYAKEPSIQLSIKNIQAVQNKTGTPIYAVPEGQVFRLVVSVHDADKALGNVNVQGLDAFTILGQQQGSSSQIVNGAFVSNVKDYIFVVRANKEGSYSVGPASIDYEDKSIHSDAITVEVGKAVPQAAQQRSHDGLAQHIQTTCELIVNKRHVVVGEPLELTLKIICPRGAEVSTAQMPTFAGFVSKDIKQESMQEVSVDGTPHHQIEKRFILFPIDAGKKVISPLTLNVAIPVRPKHQGRDIFQSMFDFAFGGVHFDQRTITSNELKIEVAALPSYQGVVDSIGSFNAYQATLNKNESSVNEPLTLTLSIEGKGNFDQIAIPKLNLPEGFKYYESKTSLQEDLTTDYKGSKKIFEFIVQANKAGSFTIQPQVFTFYDSSLKTFKKLATQSLPLEVKLAAGQVASVVPSPQPIQADIAEDEKPTQKPDIKDIQFIQEDLHDYAKSGEGFAWWLLVLLIVMPVVLFYPRVTMRLRSLLYRVIRSSQKKYTAQDKVLEKLIKKGDACALYQFFLKFLSSKYNVDVILVSEEWIEQRLIQEGWEKEKISEFLDYLNVCAQYHFASQLAHQSDRDSLFKRSKYWFLMLNK